MINRRNAAGNLLSAAGIFMIIASVGITWYNVNTSNNAATASETAVSEFFQYVREVKIEEAEKAKKTDFSEYESAGYSAVLPDDEESEPEEESVFESDGFSFLAVVSIPAINTELPVVSQWSMDTLKYYPCRYSGTIDGNDIIIAAHNYDSHFGSIKNLRAGDEILLTDASGNINEYTVAETEVIPGTSVKDMKSGKWDLTLFTCNLSGRSRVTVRCIRKQDIKDFTKRQ